ncbi:hypothetical protein TrLO_g2524 [Triparma laevis f. longispina]|uniref:RING-type domain-containing protein n=1 Tax=Triparma laevis f. longispina TaxID=1714387 RepID=A0A9W7DRG8_9STRA|nr:hypothetical protein TrLO_g2524 [Triparma laevis f. longispina]
MSAPVLPSPPVPLKGEEEEDEDKCIICLVSIPDTKIRPCSHSATCRECAQELIYRSEPCPICRKTIKGFDVGVYSNSIGERGLWPTSYKDFDVLQIVGEREIYHTVRESLEQQVLTITRSADLVKLRALAKLCSKEFFDDESLLVVAWRRILEVLELAMPEEKKVRGKKKKKRKKNDIRKL